MKLTTVNGAINRYNLSIQNFNDLSSNYKFPFLIERNSSLEMKIHNVMVKLTTVKGAISAFIKSFYLLKKMAPSFNRYLEDKRMEQAIKLLTATNLPIYEISNQIGYKNEEYFYKIFKEHFFVSPTEYRKNRIQGGNQ